MNLGFSYPIVSYIFFIWLFIILIPTILKLISKRLADIDWITTICGYIMIFGYAILTSFFIIFLNSAGYLLNLDLLFNLFIIGYFIYSLNSLIKSLGKKFVFTAILTPFLISFGIFYFLFNGEKIYKLSPYCKNTNDFKIKFCTYENGTYMGELKAFKRHGQGTYNWNSGKIYTGQWKNNLMNGSGEMTSEGSTIKGVWKKHKLISNN